MGQKHYCPTCKTELMEHGPWECFALWFYGLMGWPFTPRWSKENPREFWEDEEGTPWLADIAYDSFAAHRLMKRVVWELEPKAEIHRDYIALPNPGPNTLLVFEGPSFPLNACRVALYLTLSKAEPDQDAPIAPENDS